MIRHTLAAVAAIVAAGVLGACAAPAPEKTNEQAQAKRQCDDAPTGSNMRRCGPADRVGVITREEIERSGMPSSVGRDSYKQ